MASDPALNFGSPSRRGAWRGPAPAFTMHRGPHICFSPAGCEDGGHAGFALGRKERTNANRDLNGGRARGLCTRARRLHDRLEGSERQRSICLASGIPGEGSRSHAWQGEWARSRAGVACALPATKRAASERDPFRGVPACLSRTASTCGTGAATSGLQATHHSPRSRSSHGRCCQGRGRCPPRRGRRGGLAGGRGQRPDPARRRGCCPAPCREKLASRQQRAFVWSPWRSARIRSTRGRRAAASRLPLPAGVANQSVCLPPCCGRELSRLRCPAPQAAIKTVGDADAAGPSSSLSTVLAMETEDALVRFRAIATVRRAVRHHCSELAAAATSLP